MWGARINARAHRAAGTRRRGQGRRHQARRGLPQPARRERHLLRRAHRRRSASTTSSGASTGTRRAWASSPSSTARTTRTCWWCACTSSRRESLWKERYGHIADFEELLAEHGTIVLKFFLHITREEQEKRLLEREEEPRKAWKLNAEDWKEREHLGRLHRGLRGCHLARPPRPHAPVDRRAGERQVVPQPRDRGTIVEALRGRRNAWEKRLDEMGKSGTRRARGIPRATCAGEGRGGRKPDEMKAFAQMQTPHLVRWGVCCIGPWR